MVVQLVREWNEGNGGRCYDDSTCGVVVVNRMAYAMPKGYHTWTSKKRMDWLAKHDRASSTGERPLPDERG